MHIIIEVYISSSAFQYNYIFVYNLYNTHVIMYKSTKQERVYDTTSTDTAVNTVSKSI